MGYLETVQAKELPSMTGPAPLVSVIITSFNRPAMLQQAVASVKAQSFSNLEIIVVDDGSTVSEMSEVLASLERNGVIVIRQQNQYLGAARNAGAKLAKGAFLLFLDDDNVALESMVSTLVHAASISESKIAVNAHYYWHAEGKGAQIPTDFSSLKQWCPVGPAVVAGLRGNVFGNANFMIEKDTFMALSGFTEDRTGWEDYEFHAKAAIAGVSFVVVPEPLMLYRQHDHFEQMSANTDKKTNIKRVVRAYQHLLTEAKTSEEALHNFVERGVDTCTSATFVDPTTRACANTAATVVTAGATAGAYGGVQVAPIVSIVNGTFTYNLVWDLDYTYTSPAAGSNTGSWTITLRDTSPTFQNIVENALSTGTSAALNIGFQAGATVQCPTLSISATSLPNCVLVCFHKDTVVEYEGELHNLESLRNHPSCAIPHMVKAQGVSILTTCTPENALRLTNDHLVYSSKGLVAAGSIVEGDVLFADLNQQHPCKVVKVVADTEEQDFFGLNCLKSTVLANQIKTSTFGRLHTVPSIWMSWVGTVVGAKRASTWGDAIAQVAHRMNIF
jgi:GT2 family glycosyltransferase